MSWTDKNEWFIDRGRERTNWQALRRFLSYYRSQRGALFVAGTVSFFGSCIIALIPLSLHNIQLSVQRRDSRTLLLSVLLFFAVLLMQNAGSWITRKVRARIASLLNSKLLLEYFTKVLNIPTEDFIHFRANGNMFQRVIDALGVTSQVTESLLRAIQSTVTAVILLVVLITIVPAVAAVVTLGCVILYVTAQANAQKLQVARKAVLAINYPLVGKMIETIEATLIIKTLAASFRVTSDIGELVTSKEVADYNEVAVEANGIAVNAVVGSLVTATTLAITSFDLMQGTLTLPQTLSAYLLVGMCVGPVVDLANLFQGLPSLSLTVNNYLQTLDLPSDSLVVAPALNGATDQELTGPVRKLLSGGGDRPAFTENGTGSKTPLAGRIEISRVEFGYRDGPSVLQNLDLTVHAGEHIGLVGRSGSGKTTLFRMLLGLLHPRAGNVCVSGMDPALCAEKEQYRSQFGVVSQNDFLFNASLYENLVFGLPEEWLSSLDLEGTLASVNLLDRVRQLPKGLETRYFPDTLSGGEKQRLLIARALIRDPSVVLLDEPTSALDFENECMILSAIERLTAGRTTITIAHRLSTVRAADRILVLENGQITAGGKHDELLAVNQYYRDLYRYNAFIV